MTPWNRVHIDLIGPYTVKVKHTQLGGTMKEFDLHLTCITLIDPSTGWLEIHISPLLRLQRSQNRQHKLHQ